MLLGVLAQEGNFKMTRSIAVTLLLFSGIISATTHAGSDYGSYPVIRDTTVSLNFTAGTGNLTPYETAPNEYSVLKTSQALGSGADKLFVYYLNYRAPQDWACRTLCLPVAISSWFLVA